MHAMTVLVLEDFGHINPESLLRILEVPTQLFVRLLDLLWRIFDEVMFLLNPGGHAFDLVSEVNSIRVWFKVI